MVNQLRSKLLRIQCALKAPKNQYNQFGKFNYRSCEDILENVKPLLKAENVSLVFEDSVHELVSSGRAYLQTDLILMDLEGADVIKVSACAELPKELKGMTLPQITGCASSYARKYALNGLFAIDDNRDPDSLDNASNAKRSGSGSKSGSGSNDLKAKNALKSQIIDLMNVKKIPFDRLSRYLMEMYDVDQLISLNKVQIEEILEAVKSW